MSEIVSSVIMGAAFKSDIDFFAPVKVKYQEVSWALCRTTERIGA